MTDLEALINSFFNEEMLGNNHSRITYSIKHLNRCYCGHCAINRQ